MIIHPRPNGWQLLYLPRGARVPVIGALGVAAFERYWHRRGHPLR